MASAESQDAAAAQAAAQAQLQATREALQFLREQYEQQRLDQEPYTRMGGGAANQLGFLMGLTGYKPYRNRYDIARSDLLTNLGGGDGGAGTGTGGTGGTPDPPPGGTPDPPPTDPAPGESPDDQPTWGFANPLSLLTGRAPGQSSGLVTLRAPTGETRQVSEAQAAQFLARGAVRV